MFNKIIQKRYNPICKSEVIDTIWMIRSTGFSIDHKLVPTNFADLIINLGDPISYNDTPIHDIHLSGIQNHYATIKQNSNIYVMGVTFKSYALNPIINNSPHELVDKRVLLSDINKGLYNRLCDIRYDIGNYYKIFDEIHEAVAAFGNYDYFPDANNIKIFNYFSSQTVNHIEKTCDYFDISKRTLERFFKRYIGISPKLFIQKIRFRDTMNQINKLQKNFTQISYDSGYYDQNHMIKEFKRFSGEPPSRYSRSKNFIKQCFLP